MMAVFAESVLLEHVGVSGICRWMFGERSHAQADGRAERMSIHRASQCMGSDCGEGHNGFIPAHCCRFHCKE